MPVTKYYYPDVNLELTTKYSDKKSLTSGNEIVFSVSLCSQIF